MNGDNVLKLLSRTMEDILNIFSNNMNDFSFLLCINLLLVLLEILLLQYCWFSNIYVLQGSVAT